MNIQLTVLAARGQSYMQEFRWVTPCERYSIYAPTDHYLRELAPEQFAIKGYEPIGD